MNLALRLALFVAALAAPPALAQDAVTLQLKWYPQAQFAGYYAAADLGYYADEGLDVTILRGGPEIDPLAVLEAGDADVILEWLPTALLARAEGLPLTNVAQMFTRSGFGIACLDSAGVTEPSDLRGKRVGIWPGGNAFPMLVWMAHLGIPTEGGPDGVTLVPQGEAVAGLRDGAADCVSSMTYNEYFQLIEAGIPRDQLVVFRLDEQGIALLEDGLFVLEANLSDPAFVDRMARFVRATMRGWDHARDNPAEALAIVTGHVEAAGPTEPLAFGRMHAVNALVAGGNGRLDPAAFERTVDLLLGGDWMPVITARPDGGWSHVITDAAALQ
ncbi:MAG: ABC transporter substrate-binding protein [Bauldia sp.]